MILAKDWCRLSETKAVSVMWNLTDTPIDLLPENKPVGKALTKLGFTFRAYDFLANEKAIWKRV
jgi:hypothetical protein